MLTLKESTTGEFLGELSKTYTRISNLEPFVLHKLSSGEQLSGYGVVLAGTGLYVTIDDSGWRGHFGPDYVFKNSSNRKDTYNNGLRYVLGVDLLLSFYANLNEHAPFLNSPNCLMGTTHESMNSYSERLFNQLTNLTGIPIYTSNKDHSSNTLEYNWALNLHNLRIALSSALTRDLETKYTKRLYEAYVLMPVNYERAY